MEDHLKLAVLLLDICLVVNVRGGTSAPTAPNSSSGNSSTGQTCRTYPTAATDVETNPSANPPFMLTNTYTIVFNRSTNQITTTGNVTARTGCAGPFTTVSTWNSIADFVAEVGVIPPLTRAARTESLAGACGNPGSTQTFTYDGQNRLTRVVQQTGSGVTAATTSYTAWDSFGRPTVGTQTRGAGLSAISISYDNAVRKTFTTRSLGNNAPVVVTTTFDANGNVIGLNGAGTTAVTTIISTATVCG